MFIVLFKTFLILLIGTFSGYFYKNLIEKYHWFSAESQKILAIFLQKLALIWFISITYIGSLWIFKIESITDIVSLPIVGAISVIIGGFFATVIAKFHSYNRLDIGTMFCCGFFSNTASFGGMVIFFILGEEGYALVPIYNFLMRFLYYGIGYPFANTHCNNFVDNKGILEKTKNLLKDPFFYTGIGAIILGLYLNISGFERPKIYGSLNQILVPLTTFILLFSVGLNLKFSNISNYIKESLYICVIKFTMVPVTILVIAILLGYQYINQGLPLKVALIMAIMPVGFNAIVAANIYHLNIDMANSCWIFNTFSFLVVLPFLLCLIKLF